MALAFSRFSSAFILADIPVNRITGAATAANGVIAAPNDRAEPAIPAAAPTSPAANTLPAVARLPVTTERDPLAARATTAPAAAPVAPLAMEAE